jgi:hypothetical protein
MITLLKAKERKYDVARVRLSDRKRKGGQIFTVDKLPNLAKKKAAPSAPG